MAIERRRVYFSGRVQGVGFRVTVCRLAKHFPVAGFVRNLYDGRVEMLLEGEFASCFGLTKAVAVEFTSLISSCDDVSEEPGSPPLAGFSIR